MYGYFLILACCLLPLTATARPWKSTEGERSIQGEFITRDARSVTIRRSDGLMFTLDLKKVHPDDLQWLNANHPLAAAKPEQPAAQPVVDPAAVFDTLHFGDTREQVLTKLKASKIVELRVAESLLGRFGLNGSFQTRKDIGGLRCRLFFDWTKDGQLREVSLQTEALPADAYPIQLKTCWEDLAKLLTTLYDVPVQKGDFPPLIGLNDGAFLASHYWRLAGGGTAILGSARDNKSYTIVVRFIQQELKSVAIP